MGSEDSSDSQKWQQHLALLREQYVNLYNNYTELQQKYSIATASNEDQQSFIGKLMTQIALLYKEERYSDVTVLLGEKTIPGHKFVFAARSDLWNSLKKDAVLDWKNLDENVASILLKWIYTDAVSQDQLTLELMRAAAGFGLTELVDKCERYLIGSAKLQDCVRLYTAAEELGTKKLRDHCSSLISCHWDDLDANDFKEMPGSLLYQLLKAKSDYPLHSAVRLQREDVVFLYLVEHNAELEEAVNRPDSKGELALEVALATRQPNLARSLVEHRANLRAKDPRGLSLLHSAIRKADTYAAEFIVEQLQQRQPGSPVDEAEPESGRTALHLLAEAAPAPAAADMLRLAGSLLRAGLDPNARDRAGWSPLHRCVQQRDEPLLELLLRELPRLDLEARTAETGDTALGLALQAEPFFEEGAKRLLAAGARPNPRYPESAADCLLHRLARRGLEEPALFLLASRSEEDEQKEKEHEKEEEEGLGAHDREGCTALHEAARAGLGRLCARLVKLRPRLLAEPAGPHGDTAVHLAARHSRLEALRALLDAGSSSPERLAEVLSARNRCGETALGLALQASDCSPLLQALVEAGASLELRDERGRTALHQAILKEDVPAALLLLERGADVNARVEPPPPSSSHAIGDDQQQEGKTALQLAVHCRLGEVAEALLRRGASASLGCPLWDALESEQLEVASCLVAHGADPDCWSAAPELANCQQSLLHRAIDENREDVGQFLVRSGCDLNSPRRALTGSEDSAAPEARDECTPLHLCCQWGLEQLVQTLIEHGANVNARDAEGKTPLHVAIENQHERITSLLLCHPNINLALRDKRAQSPFAAALARRNTRAAQAILARLPSAAEQLDAKGRNFLHTAIQRDDVESILFLLSVQVDVNSRVQDSAQTTPLQLAAARGNEMLVRSLVLAGAKVQELDAHRDGPLHHAARHGHAAVVSALLQNSADFDAVNADGDNALHVAAREGHLGVARALLTECTLDAEAVNLKGRNPLHELARHGRDNAAAICELFLECMPKYPLNNADLDGNTPLLQAYMRGNGNLCRSLVKAGACLGSMNKDGVTIFNYQVATKQLLYRLLESLQQEAPWADKDLCLECGTKFSLTMRKHHCRHCGRILCSKCSGQDVPILKFGQNKPVRVCAVCFDVLQIGAD